jgi:CxxC-x17-CxxC domain-containing protein
MRSYNDTRFSNRFEKRRPSSNRSGGRGGFGGGGRDFGPKEMFPAVCDNCGKDCEVPFKPTGNKPIYCSDCFEKMGGRDNNSDFDRRDFRPSYGDRDNSRNDWNSDREERPAKKPEMNIDIKQQLDAINIKLNQIMKELGLPKAPLKDESRGEEDIMEALKPEVKEKPEKKAAKKKKAE